MAAALLNAALNVVLIPRIGITGAVLATVFAQVFMFVAVFYVVKQLINIKIPYVDITKVVVASAVMAAVLLFQPFSFI
jgi:stage V sporulation protein B